MCAGAGAGCAGEQASRQAKQSWTNGHTQPVSANQLTRPSSKSMGPIPPWPVHRCSGRASREAFATCQACRNYYSTTCTASHISVTLKAVMSRHQADCVDSWFCLYLCGAFFSRCGQAHLSLANHFCTNDTSPSCLSLRIASPSTVFSSVQTSSRECSPSRYLASDGSTPDATWLSSLPLSATSTLP